MYACATVEFYQVSCAFRDLPTYVQVTSLICQLASLRERLSTSNTHNDGAAVGVDELLAFGVDGELGRLGPRSRGVARVQRACAGQRQLFVTSLTCFPGHGSAYEVWVDVKSRDVL